MSSLWQLFKNSSTGVKVIILGILAAWAVALGGAAALLMITGGRESVAQPPTPGIVSTQPTLSVEPAVGPANTPLLLSGQNWTPGSTVLVHLNPYNVPPVYNFAVNSAIVDADGRFSLTLTAPSGADWPAPGLVRITARSTSSDFGADAIFSLLESAPQPEVTPSPTLVPTLAPPAGPTATPAPGQPQLTAAADLNIRSGPGTAYSILGLLKAGQTAVITGVSADGRWWQIEFSGVENGRGWVAAQFVSAQNSGNVPVAQAPALPTQTPQPAPTPVVITDWRGEYYANPSMSGNPVLVRNDAAINFDWGLSAPAAGVPADNFSVRWSRVLYFPAGSYRFTVRADDGVMLWVDDVLLVDQWRDTSATTYTAEVSLPDGLHNVKVAYYDRAGSAIIQVSWAAINAYPDWKGEYFSNPNLSGNPVLVRNDSSVNFNWGSGAPAAGVPADNFSVRWSREVYFAAGTYRLSLTADDGVRLWIDGRLVIDQWREGGAVTHVVDVNVPEGNHAIRLDYFERYGGAVAQLSWARTDNYPDWKAEYFNNRKLQGSPVLMRNDTEIKFNWGNGSPAPEIPADNFSVRWTRKLELAAGTYLIQAKVDDGLRLWVDDVLLIDSWQDGSLRQLEATQKINSGQHRIKIEYYERSGGARVEVSWKRQNTPANQPPQAVLPAGYTVNEGSLLQVDGRASRDPDGTIELYEWDFAYNGQQFNPQATGPTASQLFNDGPAATTVALRVTDNRGASQIATAPVIVVNLPPVVETGGPYIGLTQMAISFVGAAIDPGPKDQTLLTYVWEFGDGSQASGPVVSHVYTVPGSYTAQLTVTDKDGALSRKTTTVTVAAPNQAPQAVISGPSGALVGQTVTLSGAGSDDPDGKIVGYLWDFGGGLTATTVEATQVFTVAGNYSITLTVTDDGGLTGMAQYTLPVTDPTPDLPVEIPNNIPVQE